jgi:long-chain acyl-CoA synthetase
VARACGSATGCGVLLGNRMEYPEVACGIAKAGLVMVPLNPRLTAAEVGFIMGHSGCRALVLDIALADARWDRCRISASTSSWPSMATA